ncbi:MAG TPA: hypothetical protein VLF90_02295, partial [Patescibacteria group bacterium]|nr:hypothetical protein [Patescibacteria group bacterium]
AVVDAQKADHFEGENSLEITDELIELSMQLFDLLGIEYSKELVERYVQSIMQNEFLSPFNSKEMPIDQLNVIGTHEYMLAGKSSIVDGIVHFFRQKILPSAQLGRYALAA